MERKANQFVHKLAQKLQQSKDVAKDNDSLKNNFREVVKAMEHGRLKRELQRHLSLYFKKLMHKLHSESSFEDKSHPSDSDSTAGLDSTTSQAPGSVFNLYTVEPKKLLPLAKLNQRDVLMRLCASSHPAAIRILSSHFEDKMSFAQLKEVSRIMIGQRDPEVVFKYLSMVVRNIGTELEPALASGNEERCSEFCEFIDNVLTVVHHKVRMSGMSFPSNCNPRIESLMAALLSMLVDLSAVLSRSSDDASSRAQQIVTQVLLHLQHSPSYLVDVLLQLSSSSQDASFLAPLFRHVLTQYRAVHGNCDFLKYVCAVRLAKKILSSVIPDEIHTLSQEASFKTPTNLAMWLQESAGRWLRRVLEKNDEEDTKDIVRFILEAADDEEVQELLDVLVSDEVDAKPDDREEQQEEEAADFFFVDTSQEEVQGLPQDFRMLEDPDGAESDSDLQDEIKLADELLAELDSGKLSSSKEADLEEEGTVSDNMQMEENKIESHDVALEPMDTSEDTTISRAQGQRPRSPDLFVIEEEVSFEEMRAKALGLDGKKEELTQKDEEKEKDTEADDENSEDEEEKGDHRRLEASPSVTKVETRQRKSAVGNQRSANQRNGQQDKISSSEDEEVDQEGRSKVKDKSSSDEDSSESDSEISVSVGESKANGKQITGSTRQDASHRNLRSRRKENNALPSPKQKVQKSLAISGSEDVRESLSVQTKNDEQSLQMQGNRRARQSMRRSTSKKNTEKLESNVNQSAEIVSSSEVEEKSPVNEAHQRLSFPMLEQAERKNTNSPRSRKRSFKSPILPSDIKTRKERRLEETGRGNEENVEEDGSSILPSDIKTRKEQKLEETRRGNEEDVKEDRSSEAVSREVADYIKQIREQTAANQPRRSARIRLSSTSSIESRSDRKENLRNNPTMTLRSRRSAQKKP